jgi:hypothetical protein
MSKARDIASAAPAPSTVSATEIGYLDGVTSAIQTQLDAKTAKSTLTTTGDIYYASDANTPARLGIGTASQLLAVNSGATAPEWVAAPSSGSMTLLSTTSLSGGSTTVSSISGSYKDLLIRLIGARTSNVAAGAVFIRANGNTGGNYDYNSFSCIGAMNTSTGQTTYNPDVVVPTTANNNFVEISIPNYANASTLKFFNSLSTNETNNNVRVSFLKINGLTAAITSITFLEGDGKTFNGGTIEIYGVN